MVAIFGWRLPANLFAGSKLSAAVTRVRDAMLANMRESNLPIVEWLAYESRPRETSSKDEDLRFDIERREKHGCTSATALTLET